MTPIDQIAPTRSIPGFGGEVLAPGDPAYDPSRRVWNGGIDRRPALIARCTGAVDVAAALRFARERGLLVAVRGGGHSVAGNSVCDGGIVVDLSPMKRIDVDPETRTARAQPGVLWGELDGETQRFGLATTGGVVSTTGIAGLTLGGGIGWLARMHGLASDNLLSAEVVTAEGELLVASAAENPDLFWGLRGGGGNFGIVTSFEYRLHPVGPQVLAGPIIYPGDQTAEVLRLVRELIAVAPDELSIMAVVRSAPPAPFLPPEAHGTPIVLVAVCHLGATADAEVALRPLRESVSPLADLVGPMPYTALQSSLDQDFPYGRQYYWKSSFFDELSDGAIDVAVEHAGRMTSPFSIFYLEHLGGAIARPGGDGTAFAHRDALLDWTVMSGWEDQDSDRHVAWTREFWEDMRPFAADSVYVNNLGTEGEERIRAAYGPEKYAQLSALKAKYDPDNVFRMNQNIRPGV